MGQVRPEGLGVNEVARFAIFGIGWMKSRLPPAILLQYVPPLAIGTPV